MKHRLRQRRGFPWYRSFDDWWYATIRGTKVKLAKGKGNYEAAREEWLKQLKLADAESAAQSNPVWVIFEKYLAHLDRRGARTLRHKQLLLQGAKDAFGDVPVRQLTAQHIDEWLARHPNWSASTQCTNITVVVSALNWAAKPHVRLIERNPIAGIFRPHIRSRGAECLITPEEYEALIKEAKQPFLDVLQFLRQTGTRPVHIARITKENVALENRCVRLEKHKTQHKTGRPLLIPLTDTAIKILERLIQKYPEGPLFRTTRGLPYSSYAIANQFKVLRDRAKLRRELTPYSFRHTIATDMLTAGVPDAHVAAVLGHSNTRMIYHHYSHLDSKIKGLAAALDRVVNGGSAFEAGGL